MNRIQLLQKTNNAPGTEASAAYAFTLIKRTSYTHAFLSLVTALLLCGCKRTQSGDFAAFFVQEVAAYGGYTPATNAPVKLSARWTIQSDTNGFQIHLIGTRFAEVESLLGQTYGKPVFVRTNTHGQPHGLYNATQIGAAIQFFSEKDGVGIICLRRQVF